jgi:very-short-patch-repair endonuclease
MAAVLAGGVGAVLSHRSAAELSGLLPPTDRPPEVTLTGWRRRRAGVGGIRWHSSAVPGDEITMLAAIPVTVVPRTLLDLAAILDRRSVERAIDEAEIRRYADALSLPELLARYPRRRGTATIRAILDLGTIGTTRTKSELEERFLRFLDAHGLPRPEMNAPIAIHGAFIEADCLWREQRLIVELDSRGFHSTGPAFESDRTRDRALHAENWRVVRVTWRQLDREAADLERDLRSLLTAPPPAYRQ